MDSHIYDLYCEYCANKDTDHCTSCFYDYIMNIGKNIPDSFLPIKEYNLRRIKVNLKRQKYFIGQIQKLLSKLEEESNEIEEMVIELEMEDNNG